MKFNDLFGGEDRTKLINNKLKFCLLYFQFMSNTMYQICTNEFKSCHKVGLLSVGYKT